MARVACTVMLKDEISLTAPFLRYHADLFGAQNLYVVDNGTTEPDVRNILSAFEAEGVHVDRSHVTGEDYLRKGSIIGDIVKRLDKQDSYDLYILLDCDEFVVLRTENGYTCDPPAIHAYLDTLTERDCIYRVGVNLSNVPGMPGVFRVASYKKTIFPRDSIGETDHGHHEGWTAGGGGRFISCEIAYVHFHYRPYDEVVRFARQKLAVEMPSEDLEDPVKLRAFKGRGWHLVEYVLSGPESYYAQFGDLDDAYNFPELLERFEAIGIPAPFSGFSLPSSAFSNEVAEGHRERDAASAPFPVVLIDEATMLLVRGWAFDSARPAEPMFVRFRVGGVIAFEGFCDQWRPDVRRSGRSSDRVGFGFPVPARCLENGPVLTAETRDGRALQVTYRNSEQGSVDLEPVDTGLGAVSTFEGKVYGNIDSFRRGRITGWVLRGVQTPDGMKLIGRCRVALEYEGAIVVQVVAGLPREDVGASLQGDDRCGFVVDVPECVPRVGRSAVLHVLLLPEAAPIPGSPCIAAPMSPEPEIVSLADLE